MEIGGIDCEKDEVSGTIKLSTKDVNGLEKEYVIDVPFKNEAECILWTMVNNSMPQVAETKEAPSERTLFGPWR